MVSRFGHKGFGCQASGFRGRGDFGSGFGGLVSGDV